MEAWEWLKVETLGICGACGVGFWSGGGGGGGGKGGATSDQHNR